MPKLRVAVDIGGTFTDICILDESDNSLRIAKIPTSADPIEATLELSLIHISEPTRPY